MTQVLMQPCDRAAGRVTRSAQASISLSRCAGGAPGSRPSPMMSVTALTVPKNGVAIGGGQHVRAGPLIQEPGQRWAAAHGAGIMPWGERCGPDAAQRQVAGPLGDVLADLRVCSADRVRCAEFCHPGSARQVVLAAGHLPPGPACLPCNQLPQGRRDEQLPQGIQQAQQAECCRDRDGCWQPQED